MAVTGLEIAPQFFVFLRYLVVQNSFHSTIQRIDHARANRLADCVLFSVALFIVALSRLIRISRLFAAFTFLLIAVETRTSFAIERAATATAQVVNGFVVKIIVTDGGAGYSEPPMVQVIGVGSGAKAIAQISGGVVTNVTMINAGIGYISAPLVLILAPSASGYLSIRPSHMRLEAHVVLGRKYRVETSDDQATWISVLPPFVAENELTRLIVPVGTVRRYLRIYETE
jgi:hypothetical protein